MKYLRELQPRLKRQIPITLAATFADFTKYMLMELAMKIKKKMLFLNPPSITQSYLRNLCHFALIYVQWRHIS